MDIRDVARRATEFFGKRENTAYYDVKHESYILGHLSGIVEGRIFYGSQQLGEILINGLRNQEGEIREVLREIVSCGMCCENNPLFGLDISKKGWVERNG